MLGTDVLQTAVGASSIEGGDGQARPAALPGAATLPVMRALFVMMFLVLVDSGEA